MLIDSYIFSAYFIQSNVKYFYQFLGINIFKYGNKVK